MEDHGSVWVDEIGPHRNEWVVQKLFEGQTQEGVKCGGTGSVVENY